MNSALTFFTWLGVALVIAGAAQAVPSVRVPALVVAGDRDVPTTDRERKAVEAIDDGDGMDPRDNLC